MVADNGWDAAIARYQKVEAPITAFNLELLDHLRPGWETRVQVVTSMFRLWFVRPGNAWPFNERVSVEWESSRRVRAELIRDVPRQSLAESGGFTRVTGDFATPENALPVVEALLMQLDGVG
jgi:hypothetical protein